MLDGPRRAAPEDDLVEPIERDAHRHRQGPMALHHQEEVRMTARRGGSLVSIRCGDRAVLERTGHLSRAYASEAAWSTDMTTW